MWNLNFYVLPQSSKLYLLNLPPLSSEQNSKEFYVQNLPSNYNWDFMNFPFFSGTQNRWTRFLRHKTLVNLKIKNIILYKILLYKNENFTILLVRVSNLFSKYKVLDLVTV